MRTSVNLPQAPAEDDPTAQARYFLDMLDTFGQQGTPEAHRVRHALIQAVDEYARAEDEEKEAAQVALKIRMLGIQAGAAELLLNHCRRLHIFFSKQTRKMGTKSQKGQTIRNTAESLNALCTALSSIIEALESGDESLQEQAQSNLQIAQSKMEEVQASL